MRSRWLVLLWVAAACGNQASSTQKTIGPAGGQVESGGASVSIPAGALSANTSITVKSTNAPAPAGTTLVGSAYLFGPEGTQFAVPATVQLSFGVDALPAGKTAADVVIYTAPAGSTSYQALPTTMTDAAHVQALTNHFSIFLCAVAFVPAADAAVPLDGGSGDFSVAQDSGADLSPVVDLESGDASVCTPVVTGTSTVCTVSASCGGHMYQVKCVNGSQCTCYTDGVAGASSGNLGGTCSSTTGQPAWKFGCMFP